MIEGVDIDEVEFNDMGIGVWALKPGARLRMSRLAKTVVLAGPNGAGKTRIFNMLVSLGQKIQPADAVKGSLAYLLQAEHELESRVLEVSRQRAKYPPQALSLVEAERQHRDAFNKVADIQRGIRHATVLQRSSGEVPSFVRFVPKVTSLLDPGGFTLSDIAGRAQRLSNSSETAEALAPSYAFSVLRQANDAELKRRRDGGGGSSDAELRAQALIDILGRLLGAETAVTVENDMLLIGGFAPSQGSLSAGQQVLFQYGCMLHAQQEYLQDNIVLMDEPENHLHPAVLVQVMTTLASILRHGQLWVATHSVPLIAHLMSQDDDCLWFVNDGTVTRAGRNPEVVLESLLGGPEGTRSLQELMQLPSAYAATRFLGECLVAPGTVGPNIKDPQMLQIREVLRPLAEAAAQSGRPLRVLDFGAGKGRLLASLRETYPDASRLFDYIALDDSARDRPECVHQIELTYGKQSAADVSGRWFENISSLRAGLDEGSFDVIVLCNVLHEVHPDQWLGDFSVFASLLRTNGALLVVEDYALPTGELAHEFGFLLLDQLELKHLFQVSEADRDRHLFLRATPDKPPHKDRLVVHLIGRELLQRASRDSQAAAIGELKKRMMSEVRRLVQSNSDKSVVGRDYARAAQLLVNAELWLEARGRTAQ
ncbi:methyltransferase domain-containing protein [Mitsuaria sp. 7]|uniref:methyltransferase domain-containing protein n=1 Tax=Mitsuaria sp. 7 TaxID=1658665 RepID=UPI0007DE1725|nr:AAA family ATPase [Mitsuaria sp. 7]ANH66659.1 hypothetical protein ABE85_02125 [Mitsuaria sp. 7]